MALPLSRSPTGHTFAVILSEVRKPFRNRKVTGILLLDVTKYHVIHIALLVAPKGKRLGSLIVKDLQDLGRRINIESLRVPLPYWCKKGFEITDSGERKRYDDIERFHTGGPIQPFPKKYGTRDEGANKQPRMDLQREELALILGRDVKQVKAGDTVNMHWTAPAPGGA